MEPLEPRRRSDAITAGEAAEWHVRRDRMDKQERAAFTAWLKESPRHLREFLIMETLGEQLKHADPQRRHDVRALLARPANDVAQLRDAQALPASEPPIRRWRKWRLSALAAGMAIAAIAGWRFMPLLGGWQDFSTAIGEQRTIRLQDHSIVHLNTGSRLRVRFSDRQRDIRLLEGEALFKVRQEPSRPFRVHTREAVIQAVGTQFNVRRRTNDTLVAVIEGRVRVSDTRAHNASPPASLSAGEEADVARAGNIRKRAIPDSLHVTAWQQRRLVFRENSLADIVAEFNRYNRTPKIDLEGFDGSAQHYTGTFDADNPRSLASLLALQTDLAIDITDDRIVIRSRR